MKFLLPIALVSLFLINAHAEIEGVDLKIVSKHCGDRELSIHPKERIRFLDGMLAIFSSGENNDKKNCTQVMLYYRLASSFGQAGDIRSETSGLTMPVKREVCRDPVSDEILSDVKSDPEASDLQMTATVNTKANSGVLLFKGAAECPQGELKLVVDSK